MRIGSGNSEVVQARQSDEDNPGPRQAPLQAPSNRVESYGGWHPAQSADQEPSGFQKALGYSAGVMALLGSNTGSESAGQTDLNRRQLGMPLLELLFSIEDLVAQMRSAQRTRDAQASGSSYSDPNGERGSWVPEAARQGTSAAVQQTSAYRDFYFSRAHNESYTNLAISDGGRTQLGSYSESDSQMRIHRDGLDAQGRFESVLGYRTSDEGRSVGSAGVAEGGYSMSVEGRVSGEGQAHVGPDGARLDGSLFAGALIEQEMHGRVESAPIVQVGEYPVQVCADGKATGRAGACATANGEAVVTYNPPQAAVDGNVGAFAGARASVEGEVGVGPVAAQGRAEAWAGIGAEAHLNAGLSDGKLKLGFGAGAAYGYGCKYDLNLEIDVGAIGKAVGGVFGSLFGGAGKKKLTSKSGGISAGGSTSTGAAKRQKQSAPMKQCPAQFPGYDPSRGSP